MRFVDVQPEPAEFGDTRPERRPLGGGLEQVSGAAGLLRGEEVLGYLAEFPMVICERSP